MKKLLIMVLLTVLCGCSVPAKFPELKECSKACKNPHLKALETDDVRCECK